MSNQKLGKINSKRSMTNIMCSTGLLLKNLFKSTLLGKQFLQTRCTYLFKWVYFCHHRSSCRMCEGGGGKMAVHLRRPIFLCRRHNAPPGKIHLAHVEHLRRPTCDTTPFSKAGLLRLRIRRCTYFSRVIRSMHSLSSYDFIFIFRP